MAIETLKRKRKTAYRAFIRLPNQKRISKTFSRKCDALTWESGQLAKRNSGSLQDYDKKFTFKDAAERWLRLHAQIDITPGQVRQSKQVLRQYLFPFFGDTRLMAISKDMAREYIGEVRKKTKLKPASINKQLQLLKAIINHAFEGRLIPFNPISGLKLLRLETSSFDYWSEQDVDQFLSYAKEKYEGTQKRWIYLFYLMGLNTGMRLGEIIALSWRHVNLTERCITVCRIRDHELRSIVNRTKGKKTRHIGINDALFNILVRTRNMADRHQDLVFSSPEGNPIDPDDFRRHYWDKNIKLCGVRRIRLHDMRHTFASHFMMNGGSLYDLQALLGHASIKTTEQYAHLAPQHLQSKANVVQFGNPVRKDSSKVIELLK